MSDTYGWFTLVSRIFSHFLQISLIFANFVAEAISTQTLTASDEITRLVWLALPDLNRENSRVLVTTPTDFRCFSL